MSGLLSLNHQVRTTARKLVRGLGYEIRRTREVAPYDPAIRHTEVFPAATYSPWLSDSDFSRTWDLIRDATLVDRYRCYELWQLVAECAKLAPGDFIEIGVWRGGTGTLIAERQRMLGIEGDVYLCDTFTGVVKAGAADGHYRGGEHGDTSTADVMQLLRHVSVERVHILKGIFPDDFRDSLKDHRFRFCHVDVDVYESAKGIADWIWPRMVPGGIMVYDDYGFHSCPGITRFVNEQRALTDRLVIHNLNGHAIVIKLKAEGYSK